MTTTTETLREQRERVARGLCGNERYIHDERCGECRSIAGALRDLQLAAMLRVYALWAEYEDHELATFVKATELDALLDEGPGRKETDRGM